MGMSEVLKINCTLYTGPLNTEIKGYVRGVESSVHNIHTFNVTHVKGVESVKHCTVLRIKDQKIKSYVEGIESSVCGCLRYNISHF